jgi:aspartyl-tRNA(Asn)/glutamyl-tRNA(Gln) amidotransferase subunit B
VEFILNNERKHVGITRAHIEEDAGKSTHHGEFSLVNYNRSSVPLLEIVSEPDMRTPQEAAEYARTVRSILRYLGVCDGNLEEGSMRCDCNVSVRKKGEKKLGTRTELKNINSFRFIEKAIQYEIERQIDSIEAGQPIVQETRLYDSTKNKTFSMRSKEEAHDYRYFPEPDLIPLKVEEAFIQKIKENLPELPIQRAQRFQKEYSLPEYDAQILTLEIDMANYYEAATKVSGNPKATSNWIMAELLRELNNSKKEIAESPIKPEMLGEMVSMIDKNVISGKIAKTVL